MYLLLLKVRCGVCLQFRRSVSDCLQPGQGDPYLLRWLKGMYVKVFN